MQCPFPRGPCGTSRTGNHARSSGILDRCSPQGGSLVPSTVRSSSCIESHRAQRTFDFLADTSTCGFRFVGGFVAGRPNMSGANGAARPESPCLATLDLVKKQAEALGRDGDGRRCTGGTSDESRADPSSRSHLQLWDLFRTKSRLGFGASGVDMKLG